MGESRSTSRFSPNTAASVSTPSESLSSSGSHATSRSSSSHRTSRDGSLRNYPPGPSRHRIHDPSAPYPRPEDRHRSSSSSSSYRPSMIPPEQELPAPPKRHLAPPPLAPYLPQMERDDRQFAFGGSGARGHPDSRAAHPSLSSLSGRNPSVPPPQRPAPPHIPPPPGRSQPPPSPPSSRGTYTAGSYHGAPPVASRYSPVNEYRSHRMLSPPGSRGDHYPVPPRSSHRPASLGEVGRSRSQSSHQSSGFSVPPNRRISMSPSVGGSDHDEELDGRDQSASDPAAEGPALQRPKRTRVLMTHLQQHRLGALWKKSKFPTTQEREDIASEVGLTPRQVQVWFQNRRQTFRKQIQQNAIPHGSDPADYADLQKSPRSRRLSLEAANAAGDEADRVSQWAAASSSSSSSSYAPRAYGGSGLVMSVSDHGRDRDFRRPPSSHVAHHSRRSPSPSRRSYEERHLPPSRHGEAPQSFFRPNTASSSSSYPSVGSYPGGLNRQYSLGSMGTDRRDSPWDKAPGLGRTPTTISPTPYSPPPTADGDDGPPRLVDGKHNYEELDGYSDGHKRPRRRHTYDSDESFRPPSRSEHVDRAKPSHLPPSLAALAITRPIEYDEPRGPARALPSLGLVLEPEVHVTPRTKGAEWDARGMEDGVGGSRSHSGTPTLLDGPVQRKVSTPTPLEAVQMRSDTKSTSASSLPRFNDLFR